MRGYVFEETGNALAAVAGPVDIRHIAFDFGPAIRQFRAGRKMNIKFPQQVCEVSWNLERVVQ
jgi:hypothetical protein